MKFKALVILLLASNWVLGQMDVTFPSNRAVFQRNNNNLALIHIAGNYKSEVVDRIEAQLVPLIGGQAVAWANITANPSNGIYRGALTASGGWYRLEVRAIRNGLTIETAQVDKVGVGEVFIIIGQSNAQGYNNYGQPAAQDDRVSCITNFYSFGNEDSFPYPEFTQLSAEEKLGPTGNGSWCWGRLGDMLSGKLNVPILFINAAWEAMGIGDWKSSSEGKSAVNVFSGNVTVPGYPYNSLKHSLHFYTSMLGVRAILMHQGETDNYIKRTRQDYYDDLVYLIKKSRTDVGKNVSWVICRASKISGNDYQPVIDAQNQVIFDMDNVFAGPNTDLNNHRVDGTHFNSQGLTELGNSWNVSLDSTFFVKSTPTLGNFLLPVTVFCNGDAQKPLRLSLPSNYTSYFWSTRETNQSIYAGGGSFYGYGRDNIGNVFYSQRVSFPQNINTPAPQIEIIGNKDFCDGDKITLKSNYTERNYWNTGETVQSIDLTKGGTFSVTHVNTYGCVSVSNSVTTKLLPRPNASVTLSGSPNICLGQKLTLVSGSETGNLWSNGITTKSTSVGEAGEYFVKVTNEFGCSSKSNIIKVALLPIAEKPKVSIDGANEICLGDSVKIKATSSETFRWNLGSVDKEIFINKTGEYFGISKNSSGCETNSDTIRLKVNNLPLAPVISANGKLVYCGELNTLLKAVSQDSIIWNTGAKTDSLQAKANGTYFAKSVDKNGCISLKSNSIAVFAQPIPPKPDIMTGGAFTLLVPQTTAIMPENVKYEWSLNEEKIAVDSSVIRVKKNGDYRVKTIAYYYYNNTDTLTCVSEPSNLYKFVANLSNNGISFYPNPSFEGVINVESFEDLDNVTVSLITLTGEIKKVYNFKKIDVRKSLDISDIDKGVYIIKVQAENVLIGKKIIID